MKHHTIGLLLFPISNIILSSNVIAEALYSSEKVVNFHTSLDLGIQSYDFKFDSVFDTLDLGTGDTVVVANDGFEVSDHVFYGGIKTSISFGNLFMNLSGRVSLEGNDEGQRAAFQFNFDDDPEIDPILTEYQAEFDRSEVTLTAGYSLLYEHQDSFEQHNLSVFLGYKFSRSEINNSISVNENDLAAFPETSIFNGDLDIDFRYDGPLIGASYSVPIDAYHFSGFLTFTSAAVFLNGDVKQTFDSTGDPRFRDRAEERFNRNSKGDSFGLNVGIQWQGLLENLPFAYYIGVDRSQYEFDSGEVSGDFEEDIVTYRIGLGYSF